MNKRAFDEIYKDPTSKPSSYSIDIPEPTDVEGEDQGYKNVVMDYPAGTEPTDEAYTEDQKQMYNEVSGPLERYGTVRKDIYEDIKKDIPSGKGDTRSARERASIYRRDNDPEAPSDAAVAMRYRGVAPDVQAKNEEAAAEAADTLQGEKQLFRESLSGETSDHPSKTHESETTDYYKDILRRREASRQGMINTIANR
ncbi:MAG: hypothetical protein CMB76_05265 [Euryarchaeota archaeon]|nr:hypothetical protein [Euryarchaeota archaeon]|tara:strand:+ start:4909 stop:5502 length:594 start_codon:yes stop_codon:yes gene_type:complete